MSGSLDSMPLLGQAAAAGLVPAQGALHTPDAASASPPINFFYSHFHNAIRFELDALERSVERLEQGSSPEALSSLLMDLQTRYYFLNQVYKYHSSVEDEVVYPALDAKVKNVTLAYSVEHQDEEALFEQLAGLLSAATRQTGAARHDTLRKLICKVEEIHTTLRKHLAKEEAQLLPLLTQVRQLSHGAARLQFYVFDASFA